MANKDNNLFSRLIKYYYDKTLYAQADKLSALQLSPPQFYKPSADGSLLLNWACIFSGSFAANAPQEISQVLRACVTQHEETIDNFDFSHIQSLSNSKGFGSNWLAKINGSWFNDAATWGAAMYPDSNLSGLDDQDWAANIRHIEREGFPQSRPITVHYYAWLDRYKAVQPGGSHHCAMVLHQMKEQKRAYTRQATLTRYAINTTTIEQLSRRYCLFVTANTVTDLTLSHNTIDLLTAIYKHISPKACTIPIAPSVNNAVIGCIPYDSLSIDHSIFQRWYAIHVKRGSIVPLVTLLNNTLASCTTPYVHALDSCYLGDPYRKNDIRAKNIPLATREETAS